MTAHENKIVGEGLTYDDVLLVPAFSEVLPREVNIQTKFTRNISINIPVVSAAMDTVTESKMAIAMAQEGGIGVLHKNMTIDQQADKVRRTSGKGRQHHGFWCQSGVITTIFRRGIHKQGFSAGIIRIKL